MPSIEFYYIPESPPCRAVEMTASIIGVTLNKHYVNLFTGDHLKDDYVRMNPLCDVPFIIDGDLAINECRAIMTYLVSQYGSHKQYLYPLDPKVRARVDALLYFEMGTLYQSAYDLFKPMLLGPIDGFDAGHERIFRAALHYLDRRLGTNGAKRFVFSHQLTVADISLAATFTFPIACGYDLHEYKHLVAYLERLRAAIKNYEEINDEPVENLRKFIQTKQGKLSC